VNSTLLLFSCNVCCGSDEPYVGDSGSEGHRLLLRIALLEALLSNLVRPVLLLFGINADVLRSGPRNEWDKEHFAPNLQLPFKKYLQTMFSDGGSLLCEKRQFFPAVHAPLLKNLQGMC
jgi:hypothetical protein